MHSRHATDEFHARSRWHRGLFAIAKNGLIGREVVDIKSQMVGLLFLFDIVRQLLAERIVHHGIGRVLLIRMIVLIFATAATGEQQQKGGEI